MVQPSGKPLQSALLDPIGGLAEGNQHTQGLPPDLDGSSNDQQTTRVT